MAEPHSTGLTGAKRAYAVWDVKSVEDDLRIVEGLATTPSTDRMGDIVEPQGAQFALPMPLLWQHRSDQPIGQVIAAQASESGIRIKAQIAKGLGIARIDEAWQLIKSGLVRGLSIGFAPIEESEIKGTWGSRYTKWDWLELSAVTIPANAEASIQTIKSFDREGPAASGTTVVRITTTPGATGTVRLSRRPDVSMKTIQEKIAAFSAEKDAKVAKMNTLVEGTDGSTMDAAQQQDFDTLETEVKALDDQLSRLETLDKLNRTKARPVAGNTADEGSRSRSDAAHVITVRPNLEKGIRYARYAAIVAASKGNVLLAAEMAKQRFPDDDLLAAVFKTAVAAGTTTASHWADDLVPYQALASDFIEYLRPGNIVDRIQGFDRVPFNVRVGGFSAGTTGYWKGEGKPIPVSKATSTSVSLTWATVGGLVVLTQELVRFSTPSAETKIRNDIARALNARMDIDFVDPTKAAVANVSPASVTYGVAATAPTGTTAAKFRADLATMLGVFATNNLNAPSVIIMSKTQATQLALMINTLGNPDFPGMTPDGGSIAGISVIVSEHLTSVGSPSTQTIILLQPSEVFLADDGQVSVDASAEASIEMLDSSLLQDATNGTGASLVNLWQNGLLGLRAERVVTWKVRRSNVAQYISPAAYVVQ